VKYKDLVANTPVTNSASNEFLFLFQPSVRFVALLDVEMQYVLTGVDVCIIPPYSVWLEVEVPYNKLAHKHEKQGKSSMGYTYTFLRVLLEDGDVN
jgi:hypothetical protein